MLRRVVRSAATMLALLGGSYVVAGVVGRWRLRLAGSRLLAALPERAVPAPLRVLPPPADERVGVWRVSPAEARRRLPTAGFSEQIRAYLHALHRDGDTVHETGSFVRRPDGLTGDWQLHVRLFPTVDGTTELWAHWERNPYVAPIAHLRRDGYDPAAGERRLRRLLDDLGQPSSAGAR